MKKLFLRDGKLMIGEFPDSADISWQPGNPSILDIESAKASAVEVVPDWRAVKFDAENQIWWLLDPTQGIYDEMKEGQLYDGDACGICGGPCVVGSKGLYCPKCQPNKALNEVGIVATGIPEAEQPEALAFLNEDDWTVPESGAPTYAARLACTRWLSQCLEFGWRKDQLDGLEKIWWQHHDRNGVLVKPDKAVSPPSQAESEFTELEAAQAEYIALLLMEIDSLVGIAHVHGWKSQLVELGKRCRDRVVELQKHKKP